MLLLLHRILLRQRIIHLNTYYFKGNKEALNYAIGSKWIAVLVGWNPIILIHEWGNLNES
jgi:hypothetical protein